MRKVCLTLLLYLSLYDFYSVKIQPRACSLPLSWIVVEYHSQSDWANLHPLQAANCCRNSRLAVDEDDLKWLKN